MNLSRFLLCVLGASLSWLKPASCADAGSASLLTFQQKCLVVRGFQNRLFEFQRTLDEPDEQKQQQLRQPLAGQLVKEFETAHLPESGPGSDFFRYYHARLLIMAGDFKNGRQRLLPLAAKQDIAPEAVDGMLESDVLASQLSDEGGKRRRHYWQTLGRLLPVSWYGCSEGRGMMRLSALVDPPPPQVPGIPEATVDNPLSQVADRLFEMKMYDRAALAYAEAIYGPFTGGSIRFWNTESWLSRLTAPLWLKAAQAKWLGGDINKAADYMAKAIVFGKDDFMEQALAVLKSWRESPRPQQAPAPQPDAQRLLEIARLYVRLNMHPRAIALVREFAAVMGPEAKTLQEAYEKQWLALLKRYCAFSLHCTLFGQNIEHEEERLKVVIPPPLRPAALAEAAQAVRQLADE